MHLQAETLNINPLDIICTSSNNNNASQKNPGVSFRHTFHMPGGLLLLLSIINALTSICSAPLFNLFICWIDGDFAKFGDGVACGARNPEDWSPVISCLALLTRRLMMSPLPNRRLRKHFLIWLFSSIKIQH